MSAYTPQQYRVVILLALFIPTLCSDDASYCEIPSCAARGRKTTTTAALLKNLTASYDKLLPPPSSPCTVYMKIYFYFLQSSEIESLQFSVYMLVQSRYYDPRLKWDPAETNLSEIVGTNDIVNQLWTPHLHLPNERSSTVMGNGRDVSININHDGTILFTVRLQTTLFCWMKLHKFPFDSQECTLRLDSWTHNTSSLVLAWEEDHPIEYRESLSLTEFRLLGAPIPGTFTSNLEFDFNSDGDYRGNYTSLTVTFHLERESGFYIYDYFIPSVMLVVVSWVSFWLEADAVPARVTLGTSTMLTFIILALQTGNSVPKVSYIKASEVWFLACAAFIFGSLVEFAFVNTIYRSRRKEIALKKVNSKYILKETLTPKVKRKQPNLERSSSCPDDMPGTTFGSFLRAEGPVTSRSLSNIASVDSVESVHPESTRSLFSWLQWRKSHVISGAQQEPTRMTPKQISHWIDVRSRIVFPGSFIVFNIVYWIYIYCI